MNNNFDKLLSLEDLSKKISKSRRTIDRWRKEGLPFTKIGREIYFDIEQVTEWIKEKERVSNINSLKEDIYGLIRPLLNDTEVTDIIINDDKQVLYKKQGTLSVSDIDIKGNASIEQFIKTCVTKCGGVIDLINPSFIGSDKDENLRISAAIPPFSLYPSLHIRTFDEKTTSLTNLHLKYGMMNNEMHDYLKKAIREKKRILISGHPGSGKTTLHRALINEYGTAVSSVSVEEIPELFVKKPNHRTFTTLKRSNGNSDNQPYDLYTVSGIIRYLLVVGTECICVGEIKGPEAFDILNAYITGTYGICTIFSSEITEAHERYSLIASSNSLSAKYSSSKLQQMFSKSFDIVVHMEQFKVSEIASISYKGNKVEYNSIIKK